ncbi:MAG: hypothetical protein HRU07_00090 [Nitrosopumilus sp.]|nr:hypothetical protein [Nitrosopumilus sp.]NRA04580.1 hypothetical protein [Nitrosopumilus sp.]
MNILNSVLVLSLFIVLVMGVILPSYAEYISPKKQLESGVLPEDIICRESRVLVIRDNNNPACVHESTVNKMNWSIIATEFIQKDDIINPKTLTEDISNSVEITDNTDVYSNITTNNTNEIIPVNVQFGDLIKNIPYPMFIQKISDQRLITTSDDSQSNSSSIGGTSPWPKTTLDTPLQVKMGEPFDVTLTWSMVEFDKETGEIDDISPGDEGPEGVHLTFSLWAGVQLVSASGFNLVDERDSYSGITLSEYKKQIDYDDTKIHSETITLQIDKSINYPYNKIVIWADAHNQERYFTYSGDTVFLSEDQVTTNTPSRLARSLSSSELISVEESFSWPSKTTHESDSVIETDSYLIENLSEFIKNSVSTENTRQFLQNENVSQNTIDELFAKHPELESPQLSAQSYLPSFHWILPQAFSQTPTSQVFVYGTIKTKNADNVLTGADSVRACIYERNVGTGVDTPIKDSDNKDLCTQTSSAGNFSFVIPQSDPDGENTVDVIVKAKLKHDNFTIINFENKLFEITGNVYPNLSGTIFNYGTISPDGNTVDDFSRASWIYGTILDGWNYFDAKLNYEIPGTTVKWGSPELVKTEYVHEDNYIRLNKIIDLKRSVYTPDESSPATILHEYGHHIQKSIYQKNNSPFPGDTSTCASHKVYDTSDSECAWTEGWAHFVALLITDSPTASFSAYQYPINFETGRYNIGGDIIGGQPFAEGKKVEGRIASTLWDIYDSTNESGG